MQGWISKEINMTDCEKIERQILLEKASKVEVKENSLTCCETPKLSFKNMAGTLADELAGYGNVTIECENCGFILSDDGELIDWKENRQ